MPLGPGTKPSPGRKDSTTVGFVVAVVEYAAETVGFAVAASAKAVADAAVEAPAGDAADGVSAYAALVAVDSSSSSFAWPEQFAESAVGGAARARSGVEVGAGGQVPAGYAHDYRFECVAGAVDRTVAGGWGAAESLA